MQPKVASQAYVYSIVPWVLFALFATAASMLATWNEPVRHWETRIYFAWPILLASPVLIPWLFYSVYVIWRHAGRRRKQGQWVGYVFATFAAVSMAWVLEQSARGEYAERIIKAVESYKTRHGRYPETLEQVGFKTRFENGQNTGSDRWGIAYVGDSVGGGSPAVFYPGPLPFSMNVYRFNEARWTYSED
jgi:hypothetical protein